ENRRVFWRDVRCSFTSEERQRDGECFRGPEEWYIRPVVEEPATTQTCRVRANRGERAVERDRNGRAGICPRRNVHVAADEQRPTIRCGIVRCNSLVDRRERSRAVVHVDDEIDGVGRRDRYVRVELEGAVAVGE